MELQEYPEAKWKTSGRRALWRGPLKEEYRMREVRGDTKVVAVFGHPVAHSVSPAMHNAAFEAIGLNWCYVAFDIRPEAIGSAVEAVRALGMIGVNVTVPHKGAVMPYLDDVDSMARRVGAVNTIHNRCDRLVGYNTDVAGFLRLLESHEVNPEGLSVLLLGAGGAAKAVACALLEAKVARLNILNRTVEKAKVLAASLAAQDDGTPVEFGPLQSEALTDAVAEAELIVNTTSYGMHPNDDVPSIIPGDLLNSRHTVCDLVYNPQKTSLLVAAWEAGAKVIPGLPMLVYQGAVSFEIWTSQPAPVDVMMRAAQQAMDRRR